MFPIETGIPPLGSSLVLILFDVNTDPSLDVIPVNMTVVTPVAPLPLSIILKFLLGLKNVDGDWNTPFTNSIPLPPVLPIPIVLAPPTVNLKSDFIPVN